MREAETAAGSLRAGAAQVDLTPPLGTQIAGDIGRYRPAEWIMDPIYAKALVLECGGKKLCILSLDLLAICRPWVEEIRRGAAELGYEPEAVMCHVVQNHAAPSLGHLMVSDECDMVPPELDWLCGGDDRYHPMAVECILEAIRLADERLEPVRMAVGRAMDGRVAFNRRFVMRDGTAEMNPRARLDEVLYREGPIDPEVGVAWFTTPDLRTVAALLHHTCHPVHGYPKRYISAGWPGAWSNEMRRFLDPDCVPLVINGCCGNVHHADILNPDHVDDFHRMGRLLAQSTRKAMETAWCRGVDRIDWATRHVAIPLRTLAPEVVRDARERLRQHPEPEWVDETHTVVTRAWWYAVSNVDLAEYTKRHPTFDYEIQAFRIGDVALVALTGELFVQGQLRLKVESPQPFTFVAHMSNAYVGYIPTPEAIGRGGYESNPWWSSKLAPEALDTIVNESVGLLDDLFAREP